MLDAAAVIFAAGIRPNTSLAKDAGIAVNRGIVVNDQMAKLTRTASSRSANAPSIAVPAMVSLSPPMSRRVRWWQTPPGAARLEGQRGCDQSEGLGCQRFRPVISSASRVARKSLSDVADAALKLVISDGRLPGAVLIGDTSDALWCIRDDPWLHDHHRDPQAPDVRPRARHAGQGGMQADAMTSVNPKLRATKTTCPYCGVGCGVLATPDGWRCGDRGRSRTSRQFRPAVLQGLGARRDRRSRRPAAASDDPLQQGEAGARGVERRARSRRGRLRSTSSRARRRRRRVLSLRPTADRGLLRRQQADEGLHRLGQCRHQLAAVHGLVGRRPSPRLRRRHRARLL